MIRKIRGLLKKGDVQFEVLDINAIINDVLELFQNSIRMNDVTLLLDLSPGLPKVSGDRIRLEQVLLNIMTNSLEAMKIDSPRTLTIRSNMTGSDTVTVSIADSGPGINDANKEKVFQPFFTTKKDGLGMGLRICQSIIEDHGGRIWTENNPAGGAIFYFSVKTMSG